MWRIGATAVDRNIGFSRKLSTHGSIWSALLDQKVPESYVCLPQRLYESQKGSVYLDREPVLPDPAQDKAG